jgi:DHA1 family bicyclomycin/chloramphenicol resistance-like MFS transporter
MAASRMELTTSGADQRLGSIGLILYISLMQMLGMFGSDMYTPALPSMTVSLNTSEHLVSMTLIVYFIFSLVGMLLFGPISDRYGRRPLLIIGTMTYTVSSLACSLAPGIGALIILRVIQATSAGLLNTVGTALVKDCFRDKTRETVLMVAQVIFIVGPIVAPVIGAQAMAWDSWRASFYILAVLGVIGVLMSFLLRETLPASQRTTGSLAGSFKGLANVAQNRVFMRFLLATSLLIALPFLSYLTFAAYIYEGFFGQSAQAYSLFFAATAGFSVVGLLLYRFVGRKLSLRALTTLILSVDLLGAIAVLAVGDTSVFVFFACMLILQTTGMTLKPFSTNILFDLHGGETGSVSSMMNCSFNVLGLLGMIPVMFIGGGYITGIGLMMLLGAVASLIIWARLLRSRAVDEFIR